MKEQFVTFEIAKKLKELGFDELCFGYYKNGEFNFAQTLNDKQTARIGVFQVSSDLGENDCIAPLWQQAIEWINNNIPSNEKSLLFSGIKDKYLEDNVNLYINKIIEFKNRLK